MEAKWRKMRKGVLGGCVGVIVAVCLVGSSFLSKRVIAVDGIGESKTKCDDITDNADVTGKVYNPSLFDACAQRKASIAANKPVDYGAIWLGNIRSGSPDYLSAKVSTGIVDNEGEVEVFLRGAVMGPNGAPAGNNTSLTGSAQCIKIYVKQGDKVYYPFSFGSESDKIPGECKLERGGTVVQTYSPNYVLRRQANPDPFNLDKTGIGIRFGGTRVYADFSKLNIVPENTDRWAVLQKRDGGSIDFKETTVTIRRCFQDGRTYGTAAEKAACWDSNSKVKIQGDLMSVKSSVSSGNKSKSTGEVVKSTAIAGPLILDDCATGCDVTFEHKVIVKSGYKFGQRFYRKISNYINRQDATVDPELIKGADEGFFRFESNNKVYNKTVKLYPGEIYCSRMDYGIGTSSSNHGVIQNTSVCAMAKGTLKTDISLNVEGEKGAPLHIDGNSYYVAPNRKYYVGGSYISNTQKAYGLRINEGVIDDKRFSPSSSVSVSDWQKVLGDDTKTLGERMSWSNKVLLSDGRDFPFAVGSRCNKDVLRGDYGEEWECIIPNAKEYVKEYVFSLAGEKEALTLETEVSELGAVPSLIRFDSSSNVKNNPFLMAEIRTDKVSDALNLLVPYNFTNSTWVEGDGMKNIDLGSDFNVEYHVKVGERKNVKLGGDSYATQVDNATSGVYWCKARKDQINNDRPGDVCEEGKYETKTHKDKDDHEQETLFPNSDNNNLRSVAIGGEDLTEQGVEVGDIICVWSWVTPWGPLDDLQMSPDEWGEDNTAHSWADESSENKKVCGQIGKSPTIQVWGGNVLSKGELNVSPVKEKLFNETTHRFGSFGELGVFASNSGNFANGAALGYEGIHQWNEDSKNVLLPSYLGRNKDGSEEIGGGSERSMGGLKNTSGIDGAIRGIENFANALERKYCDDGASGCSDSGEVSTDICGEGDDCRVEVESCDEDENCEDKTTVVINSGMNVIVKRDGNRYGDVVISTNVQYGNSSYDSFSKVPRFIVIANNIEIGCGVKRIDGLLVATGTVNTCKSDTPEDREKKDHSNQLIVNGAIIAEGLVANRTYGAGPRVYSIVPAEIVRFDPTLLDLDLGSNDSNPKIVNITELPPRY